jgi:uncharacterized membrane protein
MKRILGYFFKGIIYIVPIFLTLYIVYRLFLFTGSVLNGVGLSIHPSIDPFIGLVVVFIFIAFIGFLAGSILFSAVFNMLSNFLESAPVIKTIYTSIKDVFSALVDGKKRFDKPVLVRLSKNSTFQRIGFVTQKDLSCLGISDLNKIAVYLPHSYNFSGNLIIVDAEQVEPLNISAISAMKFIVSGGISNID